MDRNSVIGIVLMVLLLMGFSYYNSNIQEQSQQNTEQIVNIEQSAKSEQAVVQKVVKIDSTALFFAALSGENKSVVLENEKICVTINSKGGTIADVRLKEFKNYQDFKDGKEAPLNLYREDDASLAFLFEMKEQNLNTSDYYFTPVNVTDSTVTMRLQMDGGAMLDFNYSLLPDNYLVNFSITSSGLSGYFSPKTDFVLIDWKDKVRQQEKGFYFENMYSTLTYKVAGDDTEKLNEYETDEEIVTGNVDWVAFKNQYFSAIMMAAQEFKSAEFKSIQEQENSGYLKHYAANMQAKFDPSGNQATQFQFYFGPNKFRLLQSMDEYKLTEKDMDLEDVVYLGWPVFRWINRYFTLYVFDWLTRFGLPMGIVLLLITLLMRVIVYAPTRKSFMSSSKMRVLKPKVDEISKKYPNPEDAMKRQQEMMALYSQYGANPMGGCLPMLIQMPLWIAMFNFVPNAIELRQQGFLWADDLSTYDDIISWETTLPFIGNHLSLFCLLFCATNILYSVLTMRQQRETMSGEQAQQMKVMQWMMFLMPVFFFFMFNKYSAGLNYYYFISLLASALTMWYLRKTTDDKKLLEKLEAYYQENKNNPKKKASGLAARLEALQKQQEALMEEQRRRKRN
ncbi:MAG: membrane protein insertase YidC [Bacteroidaceae bacterium]|nr:membrane protein insertase YidC [Bacteroidaceae bacterium]